MTTPTTETVIEDLKLEIEDARRNDVLYRLAFSWEVVQALIAELERLRADATETRRAALLEAAKAVCVGCCNGQKIVANAGVYEHWWWYGGKSECKASLIHALLAQEQERAQAHEVAK